MSGCLDKISCDCDCEVKERFLEWWRGGGRNMLASIISGTLVGPLVFSLYVVLWGR